MTRKQPSTYKTIVKTLDTLGDAELSELDALLHGLLEAREDRKAAASVEPTPMPATSSIKTTKKTGRGSIELKMINGCGPYRYLRYWQNGVHKSEWLGKA